MQMTTVAVNHFRAETTKGFAEVAEALERQLGRLDPGVLRSLPTEPNEARHRIGEMAGPKSEDMRAVAAEFSEALGRTVTYVDEPLGRWRDRELVGRGLPAHLRDHLLTMARLHAANRYDRLKHDIEAVTGRPATGIRDYVAKHAELFGPSSKPAAGSR